MPEPGPGSGRTVRFGGAVVAVAALALLFAYPYYMFYHHQVPASSHYGLASLAAFTSLVWATAAAWGLAALFAGRVRSLTPARASVAAVLAPLPYAVDTFRRPTTDVVPAPPRIAEWTPPSGPLDVAVRTLASVGFWRLGAVLFLVLGVARARGQRRWCYGAAAALALYGGAHGAATTSFVHGMVFRPLSAALPGALLYVVGARLAADPEPTDADPSAAPAGEAVAE